MSTRSTRILSHAQVRDLLTLPECMEVVETALRDLAGGNAQNPLRWPFFLPMDDENVRILGMMPGSVGMGTRAEKALVGLKAVTVFSSNHGTTRDAHQGMVVLFHPTEGTPLAIVDGSAITAVRTAAVSAIATRELARADANHLALLGTGVQAEAHLEAMAHVRPLTTVRVFSRTEASRVAFAERACARFPFEVVAAHSARDAVEGADLICTVTSSAEPVLEGAWLEPGCHVNAVGSSGPRSREIDAEVLRRSLLFVDRLESAAREAGDLLIPLERGEIESLESLRFGGELGDLLEGNVAGRQSDQDITVFESLGLAVEDLAAANHALERALETGIGTSVDLGGPACG